MQKIERERIERVARIYKSATDASLAMGINRETLIRLCKQYDIEPRWKRKLKKRHEQKL